MRRSGGPTRGKVRTRAFPPKGFSHGLGEQWTFLLVRVYASLGRQSKPRLARV